MPGSIALGDLALGDIQDDGAVGARAPIPRYPYFPPKTLVRTQTQIMRELDPDWRPAMSGLEIEYVFSNGRRFKGNPTTRYPSED